jgi:penicillin-binding protein 1C
LLQPWIDGFLPASSQVPAWLPGCAAGAIAPARTLRIAGLSDGSRLKPAPRQRHVQLQLSVRGADGPVYWMLDGRRVELSTGGRLLLQDAGAHRLTAFDEGGRHHSVRFTLDAAR